jgi:hypothetical protein
MMSFLMWLGDVLDVVFKFVLAVIMIIGFFLGGGSRWLLVIRISKKYALQHKTSIQSVKNAIFWRFVQK